MGSCWKLDCRVTRPSDSSPACRHNQITRTPGMVHADKASGKPEEVGVSPRSQFGPPMSDLIEFHFDFISPYALPGLVAIERVAAKHGRRIEMHPMLLGFSVTEVMGLPMLIDTPLKSDYTLMDVPRVYNFIGVPYKAAVERFVTSTLVPQRLFCWMLGQNRARAQRAARELLVANWSEGRDVSKLENALPHVVAAGFDEKAARAAPDDPSVKQDLEDRVQASIDRGVFGSPTFIVDGEMFWGSDRTHVIDRWLEAGGW